MDLKSNQTVRLRMINKVELIESGLFPFSDRKLNLIGWKAIIQNINIFANRKTKICR